MADFTTVITDKTVLDQSQVSLWNEGVILAADEMLIMDQFVSQKKTAKSADYKFIKFANLANATSALTDGEDVTSEAIVDSVVTITPVEQGNVVTTTALGDASTGGRLDPAVVELIGKNMGTSKDVLAIQALEAATNEIIVTQATEAELTASDKMTTAYMEKVYNKLRRANIPKIGQNYISVIHPDVVSDLRNVAAAGDWVDISKYSNVMDVYKNEIGMFKGFRLIENANITINTDVGAGAVDTYHSLFFGYNALGLAEAIAPGMRITGPFDKLGRLLNFGWYGIFKYGIIDASAIWKVTSASSFGANV
jgi:N4-gp56 family major capsid protein